MNEFLFGILEWIRGWGGHYGLAVVIFTILIRLVLTPLDIKSRVSMRKTTKLQPQLQALQKKYANDKEKLNAKTAELYKKEGVNPLSSCLPLLLTWPILIIVFSAMRTAANRELLSQVTDILNNHAPTMEPWLWIKNLWMPDSFFSPAWPDAGTLRMIPSDMWQSWFNGFGENLPALLQGAGLTAESFSNANLTATLQTLATQMSQNPAYVEAMQTMPGWEISIPLMSTLRVVNQYNGWMLLPILSAVTQIIMTKVMSGKQEQKDKLAKAQEQQQNPMSGKFMTWFFPIFSLVICFGYSSAFALYWVAGNVVSMIQTLIINKVLDEREKKSGPLAGEGTVK